LFTYTTLFRSVVSCVTPDGVANAILTIEQSDGQMLVGSDALGATSLALGPGDWTMTRGDGTTEHAAVMGKGITEADPYLVSEVGGVTFLGREATAYRLERDGQVRAELILDDLTGVVVRSTTYGADGARYCLHRFKIGRHTSELQSRENLVCRLLLEKKKVRE